MGNITIPNLTRVAPFLPREAGLRAHVRRVSALAAGAAERAGWSPESVAAVAEAAALHHFEAGIVGVEPGCVANARRLMDDLGLPAAPELGPIPEDAARILSMFPGRTRAENAHDAARAAMVESANLFDEQIEGLPYEDASTGDVLAGLLSSGVLSPLFVSAIRGFLTTSREELARAVKDFERVRAAAGGSAAAVRQFFQFAGREDLWTHSREVSERAAQMARDGGIVNPEEALPAGLAHDVGRAAFGLVAADGDLADWKKADFPDVYAELLVAGVDHGDVGADILKSWEFPESTMEAVRFHHRPELTSSRLALLIYSAEDPEESLPSLARDHLAAKRL